MEKEELKTMLTEFRDGIVKTIETKTKEQTDTATKDIAELRGKLIEAEKALAAVQEDIKKNKSFGVPGLEEELKTRRFDWGKYFVGLAKNFRAQKGYIGADEAKSFWDGEASFERRVCKDYNAADGSSGGFIVPPQVYQGDVIDTVYANTAMLKLPIMKLIGLNSDMPIPTDKGNLTAYHVGETGAPTKTDSSFGLEWLRPKKIGVYTRVSNRLLEQTSSAIEMIVKNKMALDMSVELSRALTNGIGANKEGLGILGFYTKMTDTSNLGTNGRRFTIDDLADMKQSLAVANELKDTNTQGTIMHPAVFWGMLREKTEMYSGQVSRNGQPKVGQLLLDQTMIESALKLKIEATTQIPASTVGTSSTCSKVITGDWSKFVYASFRDPIFKVSDVASDAAGNSALLNDDLMMVMFLEYDCNCLRPTAFCGRDGAETLKSAWA